MPRNTSFAKTAGVRQPLPEQDTPRQVVQRFDAMFAGQLEPATLDRIAIEASTYPKIAKREQSKYAIRDARPRLRHDDLHVVAYLLAEQAEMNASDLVPVFGRGMRWCQMAINLGLVAVADRRADAQAEFDFAQREAEANAEDGESP